ncbi:MAG: cation diffusion facilitator family transporter [Dehalococcoidia bacterium]|nr:cation diffusion facilitator family transporter [Dehalococcoidia bacterium]
MSATSRGAVKLSLAVVIGLIVLKVAVGLVTGSISIMAQALDSFLDVLAILITFFSVSIAAKPADKEHPFGHGKVENIGAVMQALLIFVAGILIIYLSARRIVTGEVELELTDAAIGVMVVSIAASIFLSRHLLKVSRKTESIALEANAHNIAADVYSASAVLAGLLIVRFTPFTVLDPIVAIVVALFILKVGYDVIRRFSGALIDVKLPEAEENLIKSTIMEHGGQLVGFHALRTRKAGRQRYIDLHLVMPKNASVEEAHRMTDHIEQDIKRRLRYASVIIHIEPCDDTCAECPAACPPEKKG